MPDKSMYELALIVLEQVRQQAGDPVEMPATTEAATALLSTLAAQPVPAEADEVCRYVIGSPEIRSIFGLKEVEEVLPGRLTECKPLSDFKMYIDRAFPANCFMVIEDNGGEALVVMKHGKFAP